MNPKNGFPKFVACQGCVCVATYQSLGPAWKASELGDDFSHGWQTGFLVAHAWCWALDHRFFQGIDVLASRMASFEVDRIHFKTAPSATEEAQSGGTTLYRYFEAKTGFGDICVFLIFYMIFPQLFLEKGVT